MGSLIIVVIVSSIFVPNTMYYYSWRSWSSYIICPYILISSTKSLFSIDLGARIQKILNHVDEINRKNHVDGISIYMGFFFVENSSRSWTSDIGWFPYFLYFNKSLFFVALEKTKYESILISSFFFLLMNESVSELNC